MRHPTFGQVMVCWDLVGLERLDIIWELTSGANFSTSSLTRTSNLEV